MSSRPTRNESRRESAPSLCLLLLPSFYCLPPSLTAKCELFRAQSKVGKISEAKKKNHSQVAKADLARPSAVFAYDLENWSWKWRCSCSLSCLLGLGEVCNISTRILDVSSHINHILLLLLLGPERATGLALLACRCCWALSMQNSLLSTCANNNNNNNVAHCLLDFQLVSGL